MIERRRGRFENLLRELRIVDGARQHEGADEPGHHGYRLLTPRGRRPIPHQVAHDVHALAQTLRKRATHRPRLTGDVSAERRKQTSAARVVAVARGQVTAYHLCQRWVAFARQPLEPSL